MRRTSLSFRLLTLFTSAGHAESIEGDLLEQRQVCGRAWFAVHVVGTTLALFGVGLLRAPLRTIALSLIGVALSIIACYLAQYAAARAAVPIPLALLELPTIVSFAFLIGAALVLFSPAQGVHASLLTALLLFVMFLATHQVPDMLEQLAGWREIGLVFSIATTFASFAGNLVLAISLFLAPLAIGSTYVRLRR